MNLGEIKVIGTAVKPMEQCVDIVDDRDFLNSKSQVIMYYLTFDAHIKKSVKIGANYLKSDGTTWT